MSYPKLEKKIARQIADVWANPTVDVHLHGEPGYRLGALYSEAAWRSMAQVEVPDLADMGWLQIESCGEENVYFRNAAGQSFYCKVG